MVPSCSYIYSTIVFFSLFAADYINGLNMFRSIEDRCFKLFTFAKSAVIGYQEEEGIEKNDLTVLPIIAAKIVLLIVVLQILSRVKFYTKRTSLDDLMDTTKVSLKRAHEVLDKWKSRQSDYQYSDDDNDENRPLYLEVPMLQVAIFDSCSRKDLVSEAGDSNSLFVT